MIEPTEADIGRRVVLAVAKRRPGILEGLTEAISLAAIRFDDQRADDRPLLAPVCMLEWEDVP